MSERRALWASTGEPGGILAYVRAMQQTPLWSEWNVRHIVTHRYGSAAAKMLFTVRAGLQFIVELVRFRPTVVHLHVASHASFVRKQFLSWVCRLAGAPVVIHIHGSAFQDYYEGSSRVAQAMIRVTLRRASAIVALGEARAGWLRGIAPGARITVIPNAVQPAEPAVEPATGQPIGVVFLGLIGDRKGTFRLIDAWARLGGEGATLTIAGDGEVERARRQVQELHLEDTVQVRDWLSDNEVRDLLHHSQVLVLPSSHEGQPMAVLEAMARGLCVVASDVGGLPEMIGDGCGVLVPPDDIEAIAAALKLVICDHGLRAQYGGAARARFADQFDLGFVWRRLDELYREVSR